MKFLINETDAPDIPERLIKNHEDGNVIFFSGAGISYPANLPLFKELVSKVYERLGVTKNSIQELSFENKQYDLAISLLESSIPEGRSRVRKEISEILANPTLSKKSTSLHNSLLILSKNNDEKIRLVTTNFDRIFEYIINEEPEKINTFAAPFLPIVNNEWDGLVYLHGLIKEKPELGENGPIIISSGDFGQAYLIDRWAARFLGQLFNKYSVCFIGYSVEDPIIRYMTDALSAARIHGENPPEMFSFCGFKGSNKDNILKQWKAKGIVPIPYNEKITMIVCRELFLHRVAFIDFL